MRKESKEDDDDRKSRSRSREREEKNNKLEKSTKSRKKTKSTLKKKIKIEIFDDAKLYQIPSIQKYIDELPTNMTDEEYIKANDMNPKRLNSLLGYYISTNKKEEFLNRYEKFQFLLSFKDRQSYQKKIIEYMNEGLIIKDIILKNFIEKPIKSLFKEIGLSIINHYNNKNIDLNIIQNEFIKNKVYFEKEFVFKVPYKNGTLEIQYYSILNDLWFFFDTKYNNKKSIEINDLVEIFSKLKNVYTDLDNKTDLESLIIFNYLVNILYIYKDSGYIDRSVLQSIVISCLSFDKNLANNSFKTFKNSDYLNKNLIINNIPSGNYNKEINGEEIVKIIGKYKKNIEIKAKYINWRLDSFFEYILDSENFMLCVRFPQNCNVNYIKMDPHISEGFDSLFNKVINSKVVKQAMMFDDDARRFKYLYSNIDILNEVKKNTHFVCLPFENYFGYSDKKSFDIYIKSNFIFREIKKVLAIFDSLIRTQYHEFKHISRTYYHMINESIEIKTPKYNLNEFKKDRKYINELYNDSLKIIKKKTSNISENSKCFQKSFNEYGDLVEYAINGFKVEIQMLRSVLFCLNNDSWDMEPEVFHENLKFNMELNSRGFPLEKFVKGFGKIIYEYFDFVEKDEYTLNCSISSNKSASSEDYNNDVIETEILSHHINRGENGLSK